MAVSFHKFIDRLNRSGLLSTAELQSLLAETPNNERPGSAEALAQWLVKRGSLTPFQAKAVFVGHTKGLIVGNYVILDLLGVGGMGQVYKAQHRRMKRIVALKLLSPDVAKKPKLVERFHQEVEAAARLMHPNIVTAFDADESQGKHFLVMEYVSGRDLASIVRERGRLSVDRSIRCVLDAARGLEYAHRHGVVHRDVKPSNLLLATKEDESALDDAPHAQVKILDMGLARIEAEAEGINTPSDLTRTGIVMGTVDYMSPEQAVNTHEADHRSDIYSLGITLHYLVIGTVPFTGRTVIEQVLAHREAAIPSLKAARAEVPSALDAIFARMVAKKPEDRYQSMSEIVAVLESVLGSDESATDLPIIIESHEDDDSALTNFLTSMSGDQVAQQQAAAAIITPSSSAVSGSETLVSSDRSTAIGRSYRPTGRSRRPVPWGAILLHSTWSVALLGGALWMLMSSRNNDIPPVPSEATTIPGTETSDPADDAEEREAPDGEAAEASATAMTKAADRRLATWVLGKGGSVIVADSTRSQSVLPGEPLPRWVFSITTINLPGSAISPDDLQALADVTQLKQLRTLILSSGINIDNTWIKSLPPFDVLAHLDLCRTSVTDEGLKALPKLCPTLEILNLEECAIDGTGLSALAELPLLRQLGLNGSQLTSSAVAPLASMTSLRDLDLRETPITEAQVDGLRKALPDCTIHSRDGERP